MQVIDVWNELTERDYGYAQMLRFALGVSSGGAMALVLAKYFPLQVRGKFFVDKDTWECSSPWAACASAHDVHQISEIYAEIGRPDMQSRLYPDLQPGACRMRMDAMSKACCSHGLTPEACAAGGVLAGHGHPANAPAAG